MRAVPDVALSAADHDGYFVVENGSFWIVSGTSVAAPSFAGIMALVVATEAAWQGNANPRFYALATRLTIHFTPRHPGTTACPASRDSRPTGATYNLATGLGSVDAASLVNRLGARNLRRFRLPRPIGCSRFGPLPARSARSLACHSDKLQTSVARAESLARTGVGRASGVEASGLTY